MGQDDSCGICGKHYQTCGHGGKLHLIKDEAWTMCGLNHHLVPSESRDDWDNRDTDPEDKCKNCLKVASCGEASHKENE